MVKIIGVAKKSIQVFPSNVADMNFFGQSNRFSQLSFSFLMDTKLKFFHQVHFIRFPTRKGGNHCWKNEGNWAH